MIKVIAEKDAVHRLQGSLVRFFVSNGVSLKESRVIVNFASGSVTVGNPFSKSQSVLTLAEYEKADGDLKAFVGDVLNR